MYAMKDENKTYDDPLKKYTKVENAFALKKHPNYGKDPSITSNNYYPESKAWQDVKPTQNGLMFKHINSCVAECDRYPTCKAFTWGKPESVGPHIGMSSCYLGYGFDPELVIPNSGITSTTYYKP